MPVLTHLTAPVYAVILLLLIALLQACSTTTQVPVETRSPQQQQADLLTARGDYQGAARLYLQAAAQASGQEKHALELKATDNLIKATDYKNATAILRSLPIKSLNLLNMQHFDVNRAKIAIKQQQPDRALAILKVVPLSGPYVAEIHQLRAQAHLQNKNYLASARERILLDVLLTNTDKRLKNETLIWASLNKLTDIELEDAHRAPPPDPLSGWIELLELTRLYQQQPAVMQEVTPQWQQRYPGHPASLGFIDTILGTLRVAGQPPTQLALILPLSGNFSGAAQAIHDGLITAYYDAPDTAAHPQLRVYDTGDTAESALTTYRQAVAEGAQFVIGPLRKEAVQAVALQDNLQVPVLALNHIAEQPHTSNAFYQFGLAPENEAREVARIAWQDGHRRSIALIPSNEWGERVYAAFADAWQSRGGEILDVQRYDNTQTDHGDVISAALNLNSSKARHLQITRLLGRKLEFEPRRRKDVDFVFLLASPLQARLIRPQLSFYRASSVPVYSTSQVYTGQPDRDKDIDLNDIIFCDMPWMLEQDGDWLHLQQAINEHWPETATRYKRLYALGIDAYRIIPYISQLGTGMFGTFQGVTGNLSLGSQGHVDRGLRCAKFRNGLPTLLEPVARQDVTTGNYTP